ncbi:MAG: efflux RND transporter permease subunit [Planctomycetes bacterium]|nr:efflux RND transporter permease subunit [Planctomycetota bacterium]
MSLAGKSVRNSVLVNLMSAVVFLFGLWSYLTMPQEVFPQHPLKIVTVTTLYPGVAPREVEREITIVIEDALADVEEVREITSVSSEGRSQIYLELDNSVEDTDRVADEIERRVRMVENDLPDAAEDPVVVDIQWTLPLVVYALSGDVPESALKTEHERLKDIVLGVPGVGLARPAGVRERELRVEPDPVLLEGYGLSFSNVVRAIRDKNLDVPSGKVESAEGERTVRVHGQVKAAEELASVVLARGEKGDLVRLEDVAVVRDDFEDATVLARVGGKPAMTLMVEKDKDADAGEVKRELDRRVATFEESLPEGVHLLPYLDTTRYIRARVHTMHTQLLQGFVLVVVTLCLFLNWRLALFTAMGIPFALAFAMTAYRYLFGGSANSLSLFGVILVLGMLVDDGIVVSENCYRYIEAGLHPVRAAIRGTREVAGAVVLAVTTTIFSFLPLLLIEGRIGDFLAVIPTVACLALAGSIAETFLALPSHIADFVPPARGRRKERRRVLDFFIRGYVYLLKKLLRRRYLALPAVAAASVAAIAFAVLYMDKVFIKRDWIDFLVIRVETRPSDSLEKTRDVVAEIERRLDRMPEGSVESVVASIGYIVSDDNRPRQQTNIASILVDITEEHARRHAQDEIFVQAREALGDVPGAVRLTISSPMGGPPEEKDVKIRVLGPAWVPENEEDLAPERLEAVARKALAAVAATPGARDAALDVERGKPELSIELDEDRAARMGFDVRSLAAEIRAAYEGTSTSRMRWGGEEVEVVVRMERPAPFRLADLENLVLTSPTGESASVGYLARVEESQSFTEFHRFERRPSISVLADVDRSQTTVDLVHRALAGPLSEVREEEPRYEILQGGGNEDIALMVRSMAIAGGVAILLNYLVLGTLFRSLAQPFLILLTVPFSLTGVILGLVIAREPISIMSLVGTVALSGIVVNDSIVMVDFFNQARRAGQGLPRAVIGAARLRFRPILLTTITTIFGLLPLAFGTTGQEEFLAPAALVIVWGLAFSTAISLFIIPCAYLALEDLLRRRRRDSLAREREIERLAREEEG